MQSSVVRWDFDLEKLGFNSLWTAMTGTCLVVVYMFTTFASASDVQEVGDRIDQIEVRLIKSDIREIRKQMRAEPDNDDLQDELDELIDDLCLMVPEDRECR